MSLINRFRQGLEKTRNFISEGIRQLQVALGHYDEEMLDELEMLLVQADLGVPAATQVMDRVRAAIRSERNDREDFVHERLTAAIQEILGPQRELRLAPDRLNILLLVGVNGSGKTTTAGKLALRYGREGKRVLLAAADTFRAAAIEQLEVWAERSGAPMIRHATGADPAAVVFDALSAARARGTDVLIVDTAGRLQTKQNLMAELAKIRRIIGREAPDALCQTLLTLDATTGQNALSQARHFSEAAEVSGLILTKLDGNSKGGIAVAVAWSLPDIPILLAGLGEGAEDLMDFDPEAFARSLLPEPQNG